MANNNKQIMQEVLKRVDALATKLGIAAENVWAFTVKATTVKAKVNLYRSIAFLIIPALLFGWAGHIATTKLPHDIHHYGISSNCHASSVADARNNTWVTCENSDPVEEDRGLSDLGQALALSGIITGLLGFVFSIVGVSAIFSAVQDIHTVESDAYHDILCDFMD